jgi:hypothetical protein
MTETLGKPLPAAVHPGPLRPASASLLPPSSQPSFSPRPLGEGGEGAEVGKGSERNIELERCLRDPIRHMFLMPEELQPDGSTYAANMMRQCVRILERYMGPEALYDTRLVRRILGLLQQNEPRNRAARLWALCFFMCHFPPIRAFIESLTEDKQRLADLMTVMPTWIECQQDWNYTVNNVYNMLAKFITVDLASVYFMGPPRPAKAILPSQGQKGPLSRSRGGKM